MALIDKASLLFVPSVVAQEKAFNILPSGNRAPDSTDQNSGYDQTRADFTFDRGSNAAATRIGSDGLIKKYRENVLTESNNFSNAAWNVKTGTFTQGVEDPDGGNNAWSWTATNTDPYLYQSGKSTTGVSTLSIWVKGVGSTIGASFQIRTGAAPYKNLTLTGDWQRVEHFNTNASGTSVGFEYGNPAVVGDVVHIYQAQYEVGTIATTYLDSGATTGKAGVLIDLPRINYDANGENGALLLEPSRQQFIPHSEYFETWDFVSNVTLTTNTTETKSPEGLYNATKMVENTTSNPHRVFDTVSGTSKTFSFFAKAGERDWINILADNGDYIYLNVANGTKGTQQSGSPATIEPYGNGWYRCTIYNAHVTYCVIGVSPSNDTLSYTGDGTSGVYIWGAMMENGSYATSYIPNMGESGGVTRAADSCSVTGASDVIGQTEGTLFIEFTIDADNTDGYNRIFALSDNTSNNRIVLFAQNTEKLRAYVENGGVQQANIISSQSVLGSHKVAFAYKANDFALYMDGAQIGTDNSGSVPSCPNVYLGTEENAGAGDELGGSIKKSILFKERLTNSELATLTTL